MKSLIITSLAVILLHFNSIAQSNVESVLSEIEKNNTTLNALRDKTEVSKIANKTGIFLQNPEIEFNYLWGNPSSIGTRNDIIITQSFDFPTAYKYKNYISDLKNNQGELEYLKQKNELILQARLVCIEIIAANIKEIEYQKRLYNALRIANAYQEKFEKGDANIIDFNKAQLYLLRAKNDVEQSAILIKSLNDKLTTFNAGQSVKLIDTVYPAYAIPDSFDLWFSQVELKNPLMNWLKNEIKISQREVKLNKALNLPKFTTGYMSESISTENFKGITAGISIPLWENKNTVKLANAKVLTAKSLENDYHQQFFNNLKALHSKTLSQQKLIYQYKQLLQNFSNESLLNKALDNGEISLIEYLLEISIYYESVTDLLEMELEFYKMLAEMEQFN